MIREPRAVVAAAAQAARALARVQDPAPALALAVPRTRHPAQRRSRPTQAPRRLRLEGPTAAPPDLAAQAAPTQRVRLRLAQRPLLPASPLRAAAAARLMLQVLRELMWGGRERADR